MSKKVRFGLVGAGAIAQSYAQAFEVCENAELVAVADVREAAAQAMATKFGATAHSCYKAMAEANHLDAVIVSTPPVTHPEVSMFLLARGLHVLCEKPLAIDSASSRKMIEAAAASNAKLTMGSKFRYVADVTKARELINAGTIGEVVLFENAFTARVDMSSRWNSEPAISGGGVLIDNGAHSVDIMRYFLGPIAEVQAVEGKRVQGLKVEDTVRIFIRSSAGVMGNIDLSWSINKELESYINIYGTNGVIRVGWKQSKYRQGDKGDWVVFGNGYDKVQAFRSQLENFAKGIRGEESLVITHDDAIASVQVIEAAYTSMRQHNWVGVNGRTAPRATKGAA